MATDSPGPLAPQDPNRPGRRGLLQTFTFNHVYSRPMLKACERGLMTIGVIAVIAALATHGSTRHVLVVVAVVLIVASTWLPPAVDVALSRRDQRR